MPNAIAFIALVACLLLGQLAHANTSNRTTSSKTAATVEVDVQSILLQALRQRAESDQGAAYCLNVLINGEIQFTMPNDRDALINRFIDHDFYRNVFIVQGLAELGFRPRLRKELTNHDLRHLLEALSKINTSWLKTFAMLAPIDNRGRPPRPLVDFMAQVAGGGASCADAISVVSGDFASQILKKRLSTNQAIALAAEIIERRLHPEFEQSYKKFSNVSTEVSVNPGNAGRAYKTPVEACLYCTPETDKDGSLPFTRLFATYGFDEIKALDINREYASQGIYSWATRPFVNTAGDTYQYEYDGAKVKVTKNGIPWWGDEVVGGARVTVTLSADTGTDTKRQVER